MPKRIILCLLPVLFAFTTEKASKGTNDLIFITFIMNEDYIYDGVCPDNCPPILTGYTITTVDNRVVQASEVNFCIQNYCYGRLRIEQLTKGTTYSYIAVPKSTPKSYNCPKVNINGKDCHEIYLLYLN